MGPPRGALRVFVQRGTGLPPADLNGLADPYVKVIVRHMTRETRVVHECLDPVWDELVQFIGPLEDFRGDLVLRVCDRDVLKHDDAMGACRVSLRELSEGQSLDFTEGLSTRGGLTFSVTWEAVPPYELRPGKMHVQIERATDLLAADRNGLSDPYCKLTWLGQKGRTKIVHKSLNPAWDESFIFPGLQPHVVEAAALCVCCRLQHCVVSPSTVCTGAASFICILGVLHELLSCPLRLRLYDHDRLARDDPLGEARIFSLRPHMTSDGVLDVQLTVPLDLPDHGTKQRVSSSVTLHVTWSEEQGAAAEAEAEAARDEERLQPYVLEAATSCLRGCNPMYQVSDVILLHGRLRQRGAMGTWHQRWVELTGHELAFFHSQAGRGALQPYAIQPITVRNRVYGRL